MIMNDKPATLRLLLCELHSFLRAEVKNYVFPSPDAAPPDAAPPDTVWQDCRVYLHGLPEEQDDTVYPFVLIRWLGGDVESDESGATHVRDTVALVLGIHSPRAHAEAGLLLAELVDSLRRSLWRNPPLAHRFSLVEPLRVTTPKLQQQVHRFHMATVETVWEYLWPPKTLAQAGMSQIRGGGTRADSYAMPDLAGQQTI